MPSYPIWKAEAQLFPLVFSDIVQRKERHFFNQSDAKAWLAEVVRAYLGIDGDVLTDWFPCGPANDPHSTWLGMEFNKAGNIVHYSMRQVTVYSSEPQPSVIPAQPGQSAKPGNPGDIVDVVTRAREVGGC